MTKTFAPKKKPYLTEKAMASPIFVQIWFRLRIILDWIVDYIFSLYWEGERQPIPDLEQKASFLAESATNIARKIREKQLTSEQVVMACMGRILQVNPIINAVTDQRYVKALEEARGIDKRIQVGISDEEFNEKPYLGVPFTTKECHAVEGLLLTLGSRLRSHIRAHEDSECVRLMKEAGAIIVAVSNVPEILLWQETRNMVFGMTKNPYHTGRTVGGSSGGEAALVASLASPIGLCSDLGGSTRMPAFYCGLFGHHTTHGLASYKGLALRTGKEESMCAIGFMTKHVEDLAPLVKVVAGEKAHLLKLDRSVNVSSIRFYYTETSKDLLCSPVSSDLRQAMNRVLDMLRSMQLTPEPYYHEAFNHMYPLWKHCMTREPEKFANMVTDRKSVANGTVELVKKLFGLSKHTIGAIFMLLDDQLLPTVDKEWAENTTEALRKDLLEKLDDTGVLLFPSSSAPTPYHYSAFLRPYNVSYLSILNTIKFPTTQVPLGLNSAGLPLGIQVVAAPFNDALCLQVAEYLEKQFGGFVPPCKVLH